MTTTARPSLLAFVKALAAAEFRAMTRTDFQAFMDAPADTRIAEVEIDGITYLALLTSGAGADEDEGVHFYDVNADGGFVLSIDTL